MVNSLILSKEGGVDSGEDACEECIGGGDDGLGLEVEAVI